jgi:Domain of unknown function (DUF4124)
MGLQIEEYALDYPAVPPHNGGRSHGVTRLKNIAWLICNGTLLALLSTASGAQQPQGNGRLMYKWVDAQGMTHYGDHIPPEYAAQEQHVINAQGVEVQRLDAQKTPEQIAAEDLKKLKAEQQEGRDKNLLSTYVSVQEIERLRDQRLALLQDQIKVTSQFLEVLNGRMRKLHASSMNFKPYSADPKAPPMSDQLAEDLVLVGKDLRTQQQNLQQKRSEEAAMSDQFASDIARFKELKGIH